MTLTRRLILALALMAGIAPAVAQAPPPVPALPDTERRTSYSISGTTCLCNVGFALYGDSTDYANWVEVFLNGALVPAAGNWTITSPSNPAGLANAARPITDAILTFTVAQTGTVQIVGARRPRRDSQFNENAGVPARAFNQVLTDIIAQNREIWDKTNDVAGRAVLAAPGETLALLPSKANRLNQGACFDSNGNLVPCISIPTSTFIAGNGISLSGVGPTTITANLLAGTGIALTGTSPLTISTNLAAGNGISLTGSNPTTIATTAVGTVTGVTCGAGLSGGTFTTTGTCALALNSATLQQSPANPTATTSASIVMMGLGKDQAGSGAHPCTITPAYSTRVHLSFQGYMSNTTSGVQVLANARFGTGTAPSNGTAAAGTTVGSTVQSLLTGANYQVPFNVGGIITGLSVGVAVWLDLGISAAANTASVASISCSAEEF